MKVKKGNKVLIINDALRDRYLIDLGYEEVIDATKKKAKKNVDDVSAHGNVDTEE